MGNNKEMNYSPTKLYSLKVDTQKVLSNGSVPPERAKDVLSEIN